MRYWGKLLGLVLGVMYAPGVVGALLGLLVGHMVDRALGAKTPRFLLINRHGNHFFPYHFSSHGAFNQG